MPPPEHHRSKRAGWLRAAVLGANDGVVSIAGLVVGVAATGASGMVILASGIAGTVAGAFSMAAGEYVSVQSQADTELADLALERQGLAEHPKRELAELAGIYEERGLTPTLALEVARQLTAHDALAAHARDELGFHELTRPRPLQAAFASSMAFMAGAALPIASAVLAPHDSVVAVTTAATLAGLSLTGATAGVLGGAPPLRGAMRVVFWGAAAMLASGLIGNLFDISA